MKWIAATSAAAWQLISAVVVAVTAAVAGYFVARRQTSGSISTSDAATLWRESTLIRQELRDRCEKLESRVLTLEAQVRELGGSPR